MLGGFAMTNHNKSKGNKFEADVVTVLRDLGHPQAARTLAGARDDRGDLSGIVNFVGQCKNHKAYHFGPWLDQAKEQAENAGVSRYAVIAKRHGVGEIAESFAVIPLWLLAELLHE
jgi:hypothetical protein